MAVIRRALDALKCEIRTIRNVVYHRLHVSPKLEADIVDQFHRLYYDRQFTDQSWGNTTWFGVHALKCPLDMWVYQEILFERRPDLIIECGTAAGGSALYLANLCDLLNRGRVVSIDIEANVHRPLHPRITYLTGSSTSPDIVDKIAACARGLDHVMVILDSDHRRGHVLEELKLYNRFVTPGDYLIAEDTNINGHPAHADFGPGPMEAVRDFLKENVSFEIDRRREKFMLSFNPGGYLRRIT